jgi:hypothetical protein
VRAKAIAISRETISRLVCISAITIIWGSLSDVRSQQRPKKRDAALDGLRLIGTKVAKAVLDRDISMLLQYDRPDLRADDEISLKDKKSDLYCFLFDTSCIPGKKGRSVYDKLSSARQLGIKVIDGGKSAHDGHRYGLLLFYDRASISDQLLRSRDFLCKESLDRIASWTFKRVEGTWEPVTPLFDNETDTLCSPD